MKALSITGLALALLIPAAQAQELQVTLSGLQHDRGQVPVAVFADAKSFRKDDQAFAAQKAKAEAGTVTVTFDDVPPGRYAVLAYHDENDNGRLDLRFGMIPVEGYGLSNNPKVMGPPSYEDSGKTPRRIRSNLPSTEPVQSPRHLHPDPSGRSDTRIPIRTKQLTKISPA